MHVCFDKCNLIFSSCEWFIKLNTSKLQVVSAVAVMFQISNWLAQAHDYKGFHCNDKQEQHYGFAIQGVYSLTTSAIAGLASATITMAGSVLAPYTMLNSLFAASAVGVTAVGVSKYNSVLRQSV